MPFEFGSNGEIYENMKMIDQSLSPVNEGPSESDLIAISGLIICREVVATASRHEV